MIIVYTFSVRCPTELNLLLNIYDQSEVGHLPGNMTINANFVCAFVIHLCRCWC